MAAAQSDDLLSSKIHENITPIQWLFIIQNSPRYWRSFIRRACEHSMLHRLGSCFLRKSHSRGRLCPPQMGSLAVLYVDFLQEQSRRRGSHVQGKKHQQISRLRGLFDEPTCPACLKFFHTMSKMNAHVHYSHRCRAALESMNMRIANQSLVAALLVTLNDSSIAFCLHLVKDRSYVDRGRLWTLMGSFMT